MRHPDRTLRSRPLAIAAGFVSACLIAVAITACDRVQLERSDSSAPSASEQAADKAASPAAARGASSAEGAHRLYYQYVDARGAVRFTESLEDVPPAWRTRVGFVELDGPPPMAPADAAQARATRVERSAAARALAPAPEPAPVQLYWASWCGYCKAAQRYLEQEDVAYEIRDIDMPGVLDELVARTGQKGVPVIDVDGRIAIGFNAGEYAKLLATRG